MTVNKLETEETNGSESFRDSLGIVEKSGKRKWVYPKEPKGRYTNARNIFSGILLLILFGTPFITKDGHPFMLFDIINRKFILFGFPFGPHDFYLLGLTMITTIVFIFLFTAVFGRLFCGWVCPQTVFMESVFRKIDYWIEGDHRNQRRLNDSSWNGEKILKKGFKYIIYFSISFLVANMLLAWIIGVEALEKIVVAPVSEHTSGFIAITLFTGLFYFIFIWFREQACILVCPYGRLQGVLLDPNSIVIAYDYLRGEPKGKIKRNEERTLGDCIDCNECVVVCPTGIDIRNGTQLECVNCTACIDACDNVMDKIQKPRGLIRYVSQNGIKEKTRKIFTPRVIGYTIVQILLLSLLTFFLTTRSEIDVTILRTPGMFFQEQPNDKVSNLYDMKVLNKTFEQQNIEVKLLNREGDIKILGDNKSINPQEAALTKMFISFDKKSITTMNTPLVIGVYSGGIEIQRITTSFLGPVEKKDQDEKHHTDDNEDHK
ncbi:MAG TPA: cytochrome c oxidase accessory protein CcoG [Bacteroidetes bacterium]|nr:cytochrome c oxidase accessory protein CcoG [Bacteroidota bacterium]